MLDDILHLDEDEYDEDELRMSTHNTHLTVKGILTFAFI